MMNDTYLKRHNKYHVPTGLYFLDFISATGILSLTGHETTRTTSGNISFKNRFY
jgi:hypothetical protein